MKSKLLVGTIIALVGSYCRAGTFQVLESNCELVSLTDGTQFESATTGQGSLSAYVAYATLDANEGIDASLESQQTAATSAEASFHYKWKIKFIPEYHNETPGNTSYTCYIQTRVQAQAGVWTAFWTGLVGGYAESTTQTVFGQPSPNNYMVNQVMGNNGDYYWEGDEDGIEGDTGSSSAPTGTWKYHNFTTGVVFSDVNGEWIGEAEAYDLTPQILFNETLEDGETDLDYAWGAGWLRRESKLWKVNTQVVTSQW